jgi:hypothetical protein
VFDGGDHKGVPVAFSVGDRALETVVRERPEEWPGVCTVGQGRRVNDNTSGVIEWSAASGARKTVRAHTSESKASREKTRFLAKSQVAPMMAGRSGIVAPTAAQMVAELEVARRWAAVWVRSVWE